MMPQFMAHKLWALSVFLLLLSRILARVVPDICRPLKNRSAYLLVLSFEMIALVSIFVITMFRRIFKK